MYIIEITGIFPKYCNEKTKDFNCVETRYFQIGEYVRMTVMIYEDELPYFLFDRKDKKPVDRMAYVTVATRLRTIYPDIIMPYRAQQWYNEETGVLHAIPAYGRRGANG